MSFLQTKIRRIKFWHHLFLAYARRYQLRIILAIVLFLTISFGSIQIIPQIFRNNILSVGYVGSYNIETLPSEVLSLATQPLITRDESGKNIPALASHWTVSDDGKTYIVFLKDNLLWHDGSPVEAKDISIAIKNVEINALNNKAIEFKLPNPISSFPQALDAPVFKTRSFYGTGNFRITDISQVEETVKKITLVPSSDDLPKVEIKFYATEDLALKALKIGEIKVLNAARGKEVENWPNLNIKKVVDQDKIVTIFYNNQDQNFSSKEFRQALSYAISKDDFDGQVSHSPISFSSWAYNSEVKKYDYNLARAKELFSKTDIKNHKITLSYLVGFEDLAKQIKTDWEALGIIVELKEEKGIPDNFQALLAINKLPTDPDQYALWHSTQKETNITHYDSKKIDKLLEDARVTQKEEERKELYKDFQQSLQEDSPVTFLYQPYKYELTYKNIQELTGKLPQGIFKVL